MLGGIGGATAGGVHGYTRDPIRIDDLKPDISLSTTAHQDALYYNEAIRCAGCDDGWTLEFVVPLIDKLDAPVRSISTASAQNTFLVLCFHFHFRTTAASANLLNSVIVLYEYILSVLLAAGQRGRGAWGHALSLNLAFLLF